MNEVIKAIQSRRTIRKFRRDPISKDAIEAILEAGLWAPSAGGRQQALFLVSEDRDANLLLGRINRNCFGGAMKNNDHEINQKQISIAEDDSLKNAFYDAPLVIYLFGSGNRYTVNDCSVCAENMILAAWSMGIGCVYVGRAEETFATEEGKAIMRRGNISEDAKAVCCLCFGYPDGEIGEGRPRKRERIHYLK